MKMLVTGADGNVGSFAEEVFGAQYMLRLTDVNTLDVRLPLKNDPADVILHLAAATDVDACEQNPDWAYLVNAIGTQHVAHEAARSGAFLVYVSTAGVFGGEQPIYHEFDWPWPANVYGRAKLAGEDAVRRTLPPDQYAIVRAGWMFGGPNDLKFVSKMLAQIEGGARELRAVDDKIGSPTYALDLMRLIDRILARGQSGTFHGSNQGTCSRFDVAQEIVRLRNEDVIVTPVSSDEFPLPAPRADSEAMRSITIPAYGIGEQRSWQDALAAYLA